MSGYQDFSCVYDRLMETDYSALADYIGALFIKYSASLKIVLDAACGTGSLALQLAQRGFSVIGVDASADMLAIARNKTAHEDVLLLCQPLEELDLYGTVEGAVCTMDGLNHIIDKRLLKRALKRIALFLEPGGLFIFDVNTPYKHREILGDNTFILEDDGVFLSWRNQYEGSNGIVDITLDCFTEQNGSYRRFTEQFAERAYSEQEWREMLQTTGFSLLDRFAFLSFRRPGTACEKVTYITRRKPD